VTITTARVDAAGSVPVLINSSQNLAQKDVPRSRGQPAGRLGQPFYGWFTGVSLRHRGRFSGLLPIARNAKGRSNGLIG